MTSPPKISVITVVYNRAHQLDLTANSVTQLQYPNVEYIIVDGGSTDGTVDVIRKYESKLGKWISERDAGIYDAMNKGIAMASGDWINFMNCGDYFAGPDSLSFFGESFPEADVLYGDAMIIYPGYEAPWQNRPLETMWKRASFCHQACFVKADVLKKRPFDLRYSISSDFDLLYSNYLSEKKFLYVPKLICYYDFREGASVKHQFRSLHQRRDAVLSHGFALSKWAYYFVLEIYMRIAATFKKIIGPRTTAWIMRKLKA